MVGDSPTIAETTIKGQPARIVRGSEPVVDAVATALLLVTLPEGFTGRDDTLETLHIQAEVDDIDAIAASLCWIGTATRVNVDSPDPTIEYDIIVGTPTGVELRHTDESVRVDAIDSLGPVSLAFFVDGQAVALVSRRTGQTPETANEDLLLVDLGDESVTNLGRFGGWESGVADARMGEGAIALYLSAEGFTWLAAIDYDGAELWAHTEEFDRAQGIVLKSDVVFATQIDTSIPIITLTPFDLRTGVTRGDEMSSAFRHSNFANGCFRMVAMPFLCERRDFQPLLLDFQLGGEVLTSLTTGTPTVVNATATAAFPIVIG